MDHTQPHSRPHSHPHPPEPDNGHHHAHDHPHAHGHSHADDVPGLPHVPHASYGTLLACFWIIAVFMVVEVVSGWLFRSLALMSDGFHMLSDALSLGLAALAVRLSGRRATAERTFGFKRLEILAAFGNGLTLLILAAFIAFQAVLRLVHPVEVDARSLVWVASLGLLVNLFVAWWLHRGEGERTLNEQGAIWHVLGDLGASVAAVIAGVAILLKGWVWVDPALSLVIAAIIAVGGARVMKKSGHILIEGTPEGVALEHVREAMLARAQVRSVHDLHVWTLNGRDLYLSAHVELVGGERTEKQVMADLHAVLAKDWKMDHITLQSHCVGNDCSIGCALLIARDSR
ncbi:MAG TPA: cation diffusion facilitator family transporter, partial [Fibrobacteria bacterium]|nr:cation diffusion facilitator family transporter [Fibrobacteria bacterium]